MPQLNPTGLTAARAEANTGLLVVETTTAFVGETRTSTSAIGVNLMLLRAMPWEVSQVASTSWSGPHDQPQEPAQHEAMPHAPPHASELGFRRRATDHPDQADRRWNRMSEERQLQLWYIR